jgi:hypothetical protein
MMVITIIAAKVEYGDSSLFCVTHIVINSFYILVLAGGVSILPAAAYHYYL